jgi:micrococcal nuclease
LFHTEEMLMSHIFRTRFIFLIVTIVLVGCQNSGATGSPGTVSGTGTFDLPTEQPTAAPSPVSTRVLPIEVLTPPPTATITPIPDETLGLVVNVIDGDTIAVVMDGDPMQRAYQVRYLGIDAPPNEPSSPWGVVAYETNRRLTNVKVVRLVRDQTDFDDEGHLLRHVYVDNQLLSVILAEQGLARAAAQAPNTQFEREIREAEAQAREEGLGLWGQQPPTPTAGPAAAAGETPTAVTPTPVITGTLTTPTEEAEPTGEAEATEEATAEATEEATIEPTSEATTEATEEATVEATDEATGTPESP